MYSLSLLGGGEEEERSGKEENQHEEASSRLAITGQFSKLYAQNLTVIYRTEEEPLSMSTHLPWDVVQSSEH